MVNGMCSVREKGEIVYTVLYIRCLQLKPVKTLIRRLNNDGLTNPMGWTKELFFTITTYRYLENKKNIVHAASCSFTYSRIQWTYCVSLVIL